MFCMTFLGWRASKYKCAPTAVSKMCFSLFLFFLFTVTQGKSMHLETRVVFFRCSSYILLPQFISEAPHLHWSRTCEKKKNGEELSWVIYLELGLDVNRSKANAALRNQKDVGVLECFAPWLSGSQAQRQVWWCVETVSTNDCLQ